MEKREISIKSTSLGNPGSDKRTYRAPNNENFSFGDTIRIDGTALPKKETSRNAEPRVLPQQDQKSRRGERPLPLPKRKYRFNVGFMAAVVALAALCVVMLSYQMKIDQLSLEASGYRSTILSCENELSKMKIRTSTAIDDEILNSFIEDNNMEKATRGDVVYLNTTVGDYIYGAEATAAEGTSLGEKLDYFFEFFR